MRYPLLLFLCLVTAGLFAQVPQGINYQAVARADDGTLLANESISVDFDFRPVGAQTLSYSENHQVTTNEFGLFVVVLGTGTPNGGTDFVDIDWSVPQELGITIAGVNLGFTPFQSVPYALGVAAREHIVSIPAAVFAPNNNGAVFVNSLGNGGVEIRTTEDATVPTVLNAPVTLPHGAVVTEMTAYFEDNTEEELVIWLVQEKFGEGFEIAIEVTSTGNEPGIRSDTESANYRIDNTTGGYYIRVFCGNWNTPGTKRIKGVMLTYAH